MINSRCKRNKQVAINNLKTNQSDSDDYIDFVAEVCDKIGIVGIDGEAYELVDINSNEGFVAARHPLAAANRSVVISQTFGVELKSFANPSQGFFINVVGVLTAVVPFIQQLLIIGLNQTIFLNRTVLGI